MLLMRFVLILACICFGSSASLEKDVGEDSMWRYIDTVADDELVSAMVALHQNNLEWLEQSFWKVSDPDHDDYGMFFTREEIASKVSASSEAIADVRAWFEDAGASVELMPTGDALEVKMTALIVRNLFNVDMHILEHVETGIAHRGPSGSIRAPEHLVQHIEFFSGGLTHAPLKALSRSPVRSLSPTVHNTSKAIGLRGEYKVAGEREFVLDSEGTVIPSTIHTLYNISLDYAIAPTASNSTNTTSMTWSNAQAVAAFADAGEAAEVGATYEDLQYFDAEVEEPVARQFDIVGPYVSTPTSCSQADNDEQTLDMQYITGVGTNVSTAYYTATGWVYDYAVLAQRHFDAASGPWVHSMSYGLSENLQGLLTGDPSPAAAAKYIERTNREFQKLALLGVSVVVSSGDGGVTNWDRDVGIEGSPAYGSGSCANHPDFSAQFPASSPYITSVGATNWDEGSGSEVVCSTANGAAITSGGGFSGIASRPSYQVEAVNAWYAAAGGNNTEGSVALPPSDMYDLNKRGYPDVAVLGHNFKICKRTYKACEGCSDDGSECDMSGDEGVMECSEVDGTSASAPSFGGMVGLLNQLRHNAGQKPLGFLNPLLYKMRAEAPSTFFDVTQGDNKCTEYGQDCCPYGFEAAVGWDPASGLGTPNFGAIVDYLNTHVVACDGCDGDASSPDSSDSSDDGWFDEWFGWLHDSTTVLIVVCAGVGVVIVVMLVALRLRWRREDTQGGVQQWGAPITEPLLSSRV